MTTGDPRADNSPTVLIIGAGPGIGAAVATAFARAGHPLVLVGRDAGRLARTAEAIRSLGPTAGVTTLVADAADPVAMLSALRVLRTPSPLGVLVYNAAGWGGPLLDTDLDDVRRASEVNLHTLVAVVRDLVPSLTSANGSVLITGGGLALYPSAPLGVLSVGKAMTRAAALVLAQELEASGIAVATVTIAGTVEPGGPFAPARIAEVYLGLHRRELSGPEIVFSGGAERGEA